MNELTTTTKYWICTLYGCSAEAHIDLNNELVKMIRGDNHDAEKEKLEVNINSSNKTYSSQLYKIIIIHFHINMIFFHFFTTNQSFR